MAMFFTDERRTMMTTRTTRAALVMALLVTPALSACTQSSLRISPDFGSALRQDVAAQIADPDAHYEGVPAPGSASARVGLAQRRYDANQVIQPASATASSRTMGGADNGGNGGGGGSGVGMGAAGVSQ
jgi:hypothetical protein